jgi:hypothetical protein
MIALTSVSLARAKLAKREVSGTMKAGESGDQTMSMIALSGTFKAGKSGDYKNI